MTNMDDITTAFPTEDAFTLSPSPGTEDYDFPNMWCDRSSVRQFRSQYEPPLYWIITVVGGAGNLAVAWIYLNFPRRQKTMTDMYLLNLAVADLLFLFTLPFWATEASHGWIFGPGMCKINSGLYKVNLFSSMLLLTCISIDRYIVIVQSARAQNSKAERLRCSRLVCVGVWLAALILTIPDFVFSHIKEVEERQYCRNVFPSHIGTAIKIAVLSVQVSVGFCLPFVIMAFCYSVIFIKLLSTRNFQKHKAMRVVFTVVVVFVVSQLPYNGVLVMEATQANNTTLDCEEMKRFDMVGQVLKSVAYLHACLNPFLYVFVGERFRRDLWQIFDRHRGQVVKSLPSKSFRSPLSSTRNSVMSDSDTSNALSL